jgi:hypothetical protein
VSISNSEDVHESGNLEPCSHERNGFGQVSEQRVESKRGKNVMKSGTIGLDTMSTLNLAGNWNLASGIKSCKPFVVTGLGGKKRVTKVGWNDSFGVMHLLPKAKGSSRLNVLSLGALARQGVLASLNDDLSAFTVRGLDGARYTFSIGKGNLYVCDLTLTTIREHPVLAPALVNECTSPASVLTVGFDHSSAPRTRHPSPSAIQSPTATGAQAFEASTTMSPTPLDIAVEKQMEALDKTAVDGESLERAAPIYKSVRDCIGYRSMIYHLLLLATILVAAYFPGGSIAHGGLFHHRLGLESVNGQQVSGRGDTKGSRVEAYTPGSKIASELRELTEDRVHASPDSAREDVRHGTMRSTDAASSSITTADEPKGESSILAAAREAIHVRVANGGGKEVGSRVRIGGVTANPSPVVLRARGAAETMGRSSVKWRSPVGIGGASDERDDGASESEGGRRVIERQGERPST